MASIVNNYDLKKRVEFPEMFDRAGKFCDYENAGKSRFHPSMQ